MALSKMGMRFLEGRSALAPAAMGTSAIAFANTLRSLVLIRCSPPGCCFGSSAAECYHLDCRQVWCVTAPMDGCMFDRVQLRRHPLCSEQTTFGKGDCYFYNSDFGTSGLNNVGRCKFRNCKRYLGLRPVSVLWLRLLPGRMPTTCRSGSCIGDRGAVREPFNNPQLSPRSAAA